MSADEYERLPCKDCGSRGDCHCYAKRLGQKYDALRSERDALQKRIDKAKEALESHMCADDKDLDGCMACDALNILTGEARS